VNGSPKNEPLKIFWSTINKLQTENTISFQMKFFEVEPSGETNCKIGYFKVQKSPFEFYYRQDVPQKGLELLYAEGANNNKVLIHKNGFPWITFSLDPLSSIMLKESRHPIFEAGYWYLAEVVKYIIANNKDASLTYEGEDSSLGVDCLKYIVDNPSYKIQSYRTLRGETLYSIAKSKRLYLYTLRVLNPNIDFNCIPSNTLLRIPTSYARKMVVLIDKTNRIPLKIQIFNEIKLIEEMVFTNVNDSVTLTPSDFDKNNSLYSF
jgi:Protein of unknown function (DUF1571).